MSKTKIAMYACLGFGLLIGLIYATIYISTQISMDTAERRGEAGKQEQVEANPDRIIADYEWFHNTCQDIQAKNDQIEDAQTMLSGKKKEKVVFALTQTKNDMVGDYNAKAAQDYTSGQFRDADLPYEIDNDDMDVECG